MASGTGWMDLPSSGLTVQKNGTSTDITSDHPMRSRDLIKLLAAETGVPDYSDPERPVWRNARGQFHRDFGPAVIGYDRVQKWYQNDELHREGGPAIVWANGTQAWFKNNKLHREDGPAIVRPDGTKEWYQNGKFIR